MIKLEHCVLPSPEQMEFVIEGMRNPMNSWDKSDSDIYSVQANADGMDFEVSDFSLGKDDHQLMLQLAKAGTDHRKYMRMMIVMVRITAPLYWWKEFDTYKVGTVANSCSTMHKIAEKEFTLDDFSCEYLASESIEILEDTINNLNKFRDYYNNYDKKNLFYIDNDQQIVDKKVIWWQMIQCLPSSYNQTRNVMLNYEVLANIYKSRKNHKLDEWRDFCEWIEHLPWSELICQWEEPDPLSKKVVGWRPIEEYDQANKNLGGTYDWVLVKMFDDDYECIPVVAEKRTDGKWYDYNNNELSFEVREFFDMQQLDNKEGTQNTDEKLKEEIENGDFRKYMNEPTNELIGDNDNMDARR